MTKTSTLVTSEDENMAIVNEDVVNCDSDNTTVDGAIEESQVAMDIKAMYEKHVVKAMSKVAGKKDKAYSTEDIRTRINELFVELDEDEGLVMSAVIGVMKGEVKFGELKYQEVRSVVKSKKFDSVELGVGEYGQAMIMRV